MDSKNVRVRFAPSPTGPLHIGGVRTALFNYLYARKHGGTFILRIEDTDQTRFVPGAEEYIIESLKWCGISPDEGVGFGGPHAPYRQSERKDIYVKYVAELIFSKWAYYAFDTAEELDRYRKDAEAQGKTFTYNQATRGSLKNSLNLSETDVDALIAAGTPYVIRFKMPDNVVVSNEDMIRGKVSFNSNDLDDKVLFKSDGLPTYHLANVVDDYLMEITHVIRGEEWLPSLPLHVLLYRAFGWEPEMPKFSHLPLILKPVGQGKLSKRDGDKLGFPVFPLQWTAPDTGDISRGYREDGYMPDAFINMMALLGWNPGTEQEIFTLEELSTLFSLERVGKSGAKFDPEKTKWFNHQYLIKRDDADIATDILPLAQAKGYSADVAFLTKVAGMYKERVNFAHEILAEAEFLFVAPATYDEKTVQKRWKAETPAQLAELAALLVTITDADAHAMETVVKDWIEAKGYNLGGIMNAFRLALVGASKGPHIFDIVALIGIDETVARIHAAIKSLS